MPNDGRRISFVPLRSNEIAMLANWMEQPHWRVWWGDETEIAYVRDMINGRDSTRPFIFHVNGEAAGYIQYWFVSDCQTGEWVEKEPWLGYLPRESVGVDLSLADPARLSQGIGSAVLRSFVDLLLGRGHETIVIDPDSRNRRAVRAYEKAGFRRYPVAQDMDKEAGVYLMKFELDKKVS